MADEGLDDAFRELRQEMPEMRGEMHGGFLAFQRQIAMIGWALAATLLTALTALAAATLNS